jgi:prepilin-type N-terminal cleavage/methylation domain-containing protein
MNKHSLSRKRAAGLRPYARGFSLIEVVIAIAVVAVTFIGLIGLLGLGLVNDQTSSQQTVANNIAASILADLRSTPAYATTPVKSTRYGLALPTSNPGTTAAPFSGVSPSYYLYFDNSANWLPLAPSTPTAYTSAQTSIPAGAAFMAAVYLAQIGTAGPTTTPSSLQSNDMARIVVSWPPPTSAQITAGMAPAGSVDVISQFLIH